MQEHPILFKGEMVRAILEGRKTQTRRIVKFNKPFDKSEYWDYCKKLPDDTFMWADVPISQETFPESYLLGGGKQCPYGKPGNYLWVRETWHQHYEGGNLGGKPCYKADNKCSLLNSLAIGWKPSIFMPRWASRILLEITNVCIERVQDISEENAKKEGVVPSLSYSDSVPGQEHKFAFRDIWFEINGVDSWESNPWVWVIEFKRIDNG